MAALFVIGLPAVILYIGFFVVCVWLLSKIKHGSRILAILAFLFWLVWECEMNGFSLLQVFAASKLEYLKKLDQQFPQDFQDREIEEKNLEYEAEHGNDGAMIGTAGVIGNCVGTFGYFMIVGLPTIISCYMINTIRDIREDREEYLLHQKHPGLVPGFVGPLSPEEAKFVTNYQKKHTKKDSFWFYSEPKPEIDEPQKIKKTQKIKSFRLYKKPVEQLKQELIEPPPELVKEELIEPPPELVKEEKEPEIKPLEKLKPRKPRAKKLTPAPVKRRMIAVKQENDVAPEIIEVQEIAEEGFGELETIPFKMPTPSNFN